jgi:hypothetical protein
MAPRLAFHEMMGRLGVGDLHPGGRSVSSMFMEELRARGIRVTSAHWERALRAASFSEVFTRKIPSVDFDVDRAARRKQVALGLLAHPGLLPLFLTYRTYRKIAWAPPGWLESWALLWTRS